LICALHTICRVLVSCKETEGLAFILP
jgi:hypothetical protein